MKKSVLSEELVEALKRENITIINEEESIIKLSVDMKVRFVDELGTTVKILVNQGPENKIVFKSDIGILILSAKQLDLIQKVEKEFQQRMLELKTLTPAIEIIKKKMMDKQNEIKKYQIVCPVCGAEHKIVLSLGIRKFGDTQGLFYCPACHYEMDIEYDREKDIATAKMKEMEA